MRRRPGVNDASTAIYDQAASLCCACIAHPGNLECGPWPRWRPKIVVVEKRQPFALGFGRRAISCRGDAE